MTGNSENLVLELLRSMRNDIATFRSEVKADLHDVKYRLSRLENGIVGVKRDALSMQDDIYQQQTILDRVVERIERIEKRLDINNG